jgi:hypothetical protein
MFMLRNYEGTVRRVRGIQRSTTAVRVEDQLRSVNQRVTDAEESLLLRFVAR